MPGSHTHRRPCAQRSRGGSCDEALRGEGDEGSPWGTVKPAMESHGWEGAGGAQGAGVAHRA